MAKHPIASRRDSAGSARRRWLLVGSALFIAITAAVLFLWPRNHDSTPPDNDPFPLPPIASSPFLNTRADAQYVGSDTCRSCHEDRHDSFRSTGMGHSMAEVKADREPPDAAFDHAASKQRYEIRRKDGHIWHRELLLAPGSDEIVLEEHPVKYVVGSGHHSLTYLVETEGFLVESPATWYSARKTWGMSPGYDSPKQMGFQRAVDEGCLTCHAGRAEAMEGSLHRMHIIEPAIACERCHGPGSLHVGLRGGPEADKIEPGKIDHTIVNPFRLSRDLAESICQQCHLRTDAVVLARGRKFSDFRPGLPLHDFVHSYRLESPGANMTVVGHVEQLHLSRCYQNSDSLTCVTCHSPHSEPVAEQRVAHYRKVCQTCHQPQQCKVDPPRLQRESPENDCVHCHMPAAPTEIPHLAFTHHRVGIHKPPPGKDSTAVQELPVLREFLNLSQLSVIDRRRSLGLAYLEVANRTDVPARVNAYREESLKLLSAARSEGLCDPALDTALARLHFDLRLGDVLPYAESALANPNLSGQERCTALFLKADALARQQRYAQSAAALRELTRLRRNALDYLLLANCEDALRGPAARDAALESAVTIDPRLWEVYRHLAEEAGRRGDAERAAWHQLRAVK